MIRGPKIVIDIFRVCIIVFVGIGAIRGINSVGDFAALM